ncbi:hypothetical protein [Nocardioides sp.]|uniref:hypothetical protein n=1 Tax=Nocardioides sp. TaxID=35761 RepID=UPI002CB301AE|nr:hypothetical protein [Nocardioides sp.]HXH79116.1 hypothetical protein [Nocardioides sp.]
MRPEKLDQLARRLLVDILLEADERYWLKRADDFDRVGTLACREIARACRAKAELCRQDNGDVWAGLLAVDLGEVA